MFGEFKKFIMRGNVLDMAVGIVVGAAFTAIVTSMVGDLLNPVIGLFLGGMDFSNYFINLGEGEFTSIEAAKAAGAPVFAYGLFINAVIQFLIVSFVVFMVIRAVNKAKEEFARKEADPANTEVATPADIALLTEIRDLMKEARNNNSRAA
jgi:large conductance mechanosensitive channel